MFLRYYLFSKQTKTLYLNPFNIINGGENIRKLSILLIFLLLVIVIPAVSAEENATSDNIDNSITIGPEDSIQTAVNDANSSATIYLTPGTYYQNGIKVDKNLTFQGKGNAEDIIIDGQHNFVIEQSTAKDSNIDVNDFGTTNTTIIVDDKTGTFQIPTKFISINPITPNPKPTNPVTPNTPANPKLIQQNLLQIAATIIQTTLLTI